jgi:hypothetical protein
MLMISASEPASAVAKPTIYSSVVAQAHFHHTFNPIYNSQISSRTGLSPCDTLRFDAEISDGVRTLPLHLQEDHPLEYSFHWLPTARFRLFWRIRALSMLIFFPVFLHHVDRGGDSGGGNKTGCSKMTEDERRGISTCLEYAHENVTSTQVHLRNLFEG